MLVVVRINDVIDTILYKSIRFYMDWHRIGEPYDDGHNRPRPVFTENIFLNKNKTFNSKVLKVFIEILQVLSTNITKIP